MKDYFLHNLFFRILFFLYWLLILLLLFILLLYKFLLLLLNPFLLLIFLFLLLNLLNLRGCFGGNSLKSLYYFFSFFHNNLLLSNKEYWLSVIAHIQPFHKGLVNMTIYLVLSFPKVIGVKLVDYSFLDFCVLQAFLVDYPRKGEDGQSYPAADLCWKMFV